MLGLRNALDAPAVDLAEHPAEPAPDLANLLRCQPELDAITGCTDPNAGREVATGRVNLAARIDGSGSVSRADLAEVLVAVLDHPATPRRSLDLLEGSSTVAEALEALQGT